MVRVNTEFAMNYLHTAALRSRNLTKNNVFLPLPRQVSRLLCSFAYRFPDASHCHHSCYRAPGCNISTFRGKYIVSETETVGVFPVPRYATPISLVHFAFDFEHFCNRNALCRRVALYLAHCWKSRWSRCLAA
jgi:hypothetical protein